MRILGVEIKNYRNLKHVILPWSELIVVYGPNGSGKSNLIKALQMMFAPELFREDFRKQADDLELAFYLELGSEDSYYYLRNLSMPHLKKLRDASGLSKIVSEETVLPWEALLDELLKSRYLRAQVIKDVERDYRVIVRPWLRPIANNKELRRIVDGLFKKETKSEEQNWPFDSILTKLENPGYDEAILPPLGAECFESLNLIPLQPGSGHENIAELLIQAIKERLQVVNKLLDGLGLEPLSFGDSTEQILMAAFHSDELLFEDEFKPMDQPEAYFCDLVQHYFKKLERSANKELHEFGFKQYSLDFSRCEVPKYEGAPEWEFYLVPTISIKEPHLDFPIPLDDTSSALKTLSVLSTIQSVHRFRNLTFILKSALRIFAKTFAEKEDKPQTDEITEIKETGPQFAIRRNAEYFQGIAELLKKRIYSSEKLSETFISGDYCQIEKWIIEEYERETKNDQQPQHPFPAILTIDEPELHLHPKLQQQLAKDLEKTVQEGNTDIVIATHSLDFLNFRSNFASFFSMKRNEDGTTRLKKITPAEITKVDDIAETMGVSRGHLLQLISCFLFVEGEHDRIFLECLYGDILSQYRIMIISLSGASNMGAILDARILKNLTSASVCLLLDKTNEEFAQNLRNRRFREEQFNDIMNKRWHGSDTEKSLVRIMFDCKGNIFLHGLKKEDIIEYLDEELIRVTKCREFPGWQEVRKEFRKTRSKGTSSEWKDFCKN